MEAVDRVPAIYEPEGQVFESPRAHHLKQIPSDVWREYGHGLQI